MRPEAESIRLSFAPSRLRSEVRSRFEPSFCRYGFHNIILTPPANVPRTGPPKPHFQLGCPLVSLRSETKRKINLLVSQNEAKRKRNGFCFAKKNKKRKWDTLLPTCPVPARQNLTSPLTCQTGLQSQIERVGSNPLFAQNLTSEVSLAKSYGFGLRNRRIFCLHISYQISFHIS